MREIVVIGSQAILGSVEGPPEVLFESMEADVFPLGDPEKAIEIEAAHGEGSSIQGLYGYYASICPGGDQVVQLTHVFRKARHFGLV